MKCIQALWECSYRAMIRASPRFRTGPTPDPAIVPYRPDPAVGSEVAGHHSNPGFAPHSTVPESRIAYPEAPPFGVLASLA